jgi:glycosyltransferase involved in cell wall biosynthesis
MTAIYAIPAKLFLNIPMINNQITNAPKKIPFTLLGHHLTFLFSDKIISNTKAGLLSYNAPKVRSLAIYNGFDFKRIKNLESPKIVRERFGLKSKYIIGMVATLNFKKDYKTYIAAAEILLRKRMDITFLCIGDGNIAPYEDLVSPENKEHILFLGKQINVENIMNICDLGVLMTDEKHGEGISNAIMEFNALGKPVIASYGGGNAEIINQGETGYLVESRSSVELSMRISELIYDELLRFALGKNARINIEEKFSIRSMIENFNDVYKEVWK